MRLRRKETVLCSSVGVSTKVVTYELQRDLCCSKSRLEGAVKMANTRFVSL